MSRKGITGPKKRLEPSGPSRGTQAVAEEVLFNDKTFTTAAPPRAMAVCRHLAWLSFADGSCEVRNTRTAEVLQRFAGTLSKPQTEPTGGQLFASMQSLRGDRSFGVAQVIISMVAVVTRSGQPHIWLGLDSGTIEVHHAETADLITTVKNHVKPVNALAEFGGLVYSGDADGQVIQWRAEDAQHVCTLASTFGHDGEILCMYAEGNALVTGATDCTVKVWEVGTGAMQLTGYFHSQSGGVTALCRVGENMWSGDKAGQIVLWKMRTCEAVDILHPHEAAITALYRAGERIYSGSADGTIGVFDARSASMLRRVSDQSQGWITTIAATSQLSRFVVWSADASGLVQCWYQDEYTFLSRDHEQLNEASWYLSGSTPYSEFRVAIAARNAELREKLNLSSDLTADNIAHFNPFVGGDKTAEGEKQFARLQDQVRLLEERRSTTEAELEKMQNDVAKVDRALDVTWQLLQDMQAEMNRIQPSAGDRVAASFTAAAPSDERATGTLPLPAVAGVAPGSVPGATTGYSGTLVPGTIGVPVPKGGVPAMTSVPPSIAVPDLSLGGVAVPPPIAPDGVGVVAPPPPLPGTIGVLPAVNNAANSVGQPEMPVGVTAFVPPPLIPLSAGGGAAAYPPGTAPPSMVVGPGGVLVPAVGGSSLGVGSTPAVSAPPGGGAAAYPPGTAPPGTVVGPGGVLIQMGNVPSPATASPGEIANALVAQTAQCADGSLWNGVSWVNPNVGNYIQRRYYGAEPSLRTPDIVRREKKKLRMPKVKVVPIERRTTASQSPKEKKVATASASLHTPVATSVGTKEMVKSELTTEDTTVTTTTAT